MQVINEDKYLIIINKEAGLMVEPDVHGHPNLQDLVREHLLLTGKNKVPFVQPVHRIDRPVSGIVLFALKPSALKVLNAQFADRSVEKIYLAITARAPEKKSGKLKHYHRKDNLQKRALISDHPVKDGQVAELEYEILAASGNFILWKIRLLSGRYHQVRAQLAHIGCPIIGDEKYGSADIYKPNAIALHAWKLDFYHPKTNERMKIEAAPPQDEFWNLFS